MKTDITQHKLKLAKEAEYLLPRLMMSYNTGDLESLGKLCNSINVLAEFYYENSGSDIATIVPRLMDYLSEKFKKCTVLVLKSSEICYGYTANNITKFIRGESLHGASDNQDAKRKILHDYIFEKDNTVECEFQISWNWIVGPNLRAETGNLDTGGAYVHAININGRRFEVSQIESVILAIAYEFWQANTDQKPEQSTKCFVKFNPEWFTSLWGEEITQRLKESLVTYHKIEIPENEIN